MKKLIPLVLTMIFVLALSGCGKNDTYKIRITVPAGSAEEFVYSDEEILATGKKITISTGDGLGDTEVILSPVNENVETGYVATYLTPGMPVEFDAVKGEWFKIGVNMQNQTDEDIVVYVEVKNVEVRISDESTPDSVTFQGEILEIHDKYFLVKPESSWAINSADKIEVPMENMNVSPEPEVGDIIEVSYSGEILETYPARLSKVLSIKVITEAEKWDLKPMVMIDGVLYLTTGKSNGDLLTSDVIDGEITSEVDGSEKPTQNDQSNFGTGYYYRYGEAGTVELLNDGKWWIYEAESTE